MIWDYAVAGPGGGDIEYGSSVVMKQPPQAIEQVVNGQVRGEGWWATAVRVAGGWPGDA